MAAVAKASYAQFNYFLRPSKYVERKLIVEALLRLSAEGYAISQYTYLGFGSPYYVDFILFHRQLYIDDMVCVEHDEIPNRMSFNKPYKFIKLEMGEVSDVLPRLKRNRKYFVWLDYDYGLIESVLADLNLLLGVIPIDSVVLVTVNAQPRALADIDWSDEKGKVRGSGHAKKYQDMLGRYLDFKVGPANLSPNGLPTMYASALRNQFLENINARTDADAAFFQMFNFRYSDGRQMFTYGGLLTTKEKAARLSGSGAFGGACMNRNEVPDVISVPPLTVREKLWLDQHARANTPENVAFEIADDDLENYRRFSRHYPNFYEVMF